MCFIDKSLSWLGQVVSHDNFMYGVFFLIFDVAITLIVVSKILERRENKKWVPLRKAILVSTQAFVLNLFNAYRILESHNKADGSVSEQGVKFFFEEMQKLKNSRVKLQNKVALYGSGMGGDILPKLADLDSAYDHIFLMVSYSLFPFSNDQSSQNPRYLTELDLEPFENVINGVKDLAENYPDLVNLKENYWAIVDTGIVKRATENLFGSFDKYVNGWDEVPKNCREIRVFNLKSLGRLHPPPKGYEKIKFRTMSDFGVHH